MEQKKKRMKNRVGRPALANGERRDRIVRVRMKGSDFPLLKKLSSGKSMSKYFLDLFYQAASNFGGQK